MTYRFAATLMAMATCICTMVTSGHGDTLAIRDVNDNSVMRIPLEGSRFTSMKDDVIGPGKDSSVELGAGSFKSRYSRQSGIVFDGRPSKECEYMATGTGRTGVAVLSHDGLILQINHEGCFDEHGWYKVAGRLYLELEGDPFGQASKNGSFRMTHDLRKSSITIHTETPQGLLDVTVRAHMKRDVIQVIANDQRKNPGTIKLRIRTPWGKWYGPDAKTESGTAISSDIPWSGLQKEQLGENTIVWHSNGLKTDWHAINTASGVKDDSKLTDPLAQRCFGLGLRTDSCVDWQDGKAQLPASRKTTIYIAAESCKGEAAFKRSVQNRLKSLPGEDAFIKEHESWWQRYWARTVFTSDSSMRKHMAAYDMYRYFSAVASGRDREFPVRFQIELLSSTLKFLTFLQMHINSVQTIEAYYPMLRNGDWDQLRPLTNHYERMLPVYRTYSKDYYGHPGLIIPYEPNVWGSDFFSCPVGNGEGWMFYSHSSHPWSVYSFEHGIAIMQFLQQAAEAKGDKSITRNIVLPYMREQCTFLLEHYRTAGGKIVFDPATSGETWYNVKNPASWTFLLKAFLPQVIELAQEYGDHQLVQTASVLLNELPDVPTGKWEWTESGPKVDKSGPESERVYLPAEIFDRHNPINGENPELYGLWPYGAVGAGIGDGDIALRTYRQRFWKNSGNGWALDVIWAARLNLVDELLTSYENMHFPATLRCPGGFSYEESQTCPEEPNLPLYPSMQGMGTSVCHIYEMICRDVDGGIVVLPAWPMEKPLRAVVYTSNAGRVEIRYTPGKPVMVATERKAKVFLHEKTAF